MKLKPPQNKPGSTGVWCNTNTTCIAPDPHPKNRVPSIKHWSVCSKQAVLAPPSLTSQQPGGGAKMGGVYPSRCRVKEEAQSIPGGVFRLRCFSWWFLNRAVPVCPIQVQSAGIHCDRTRDGAVGPGGGSFNQCTPTLQRMMGECICSFSRVYSFQNMMAQFSPHSEFSAHSGFWGCRVGGGRGSVSGTMNPYYPYRKSRTYSSLRGC